MHIITILSLVIFSFYSFSQEKISTEDYINQYKVIAVRKMFHFNIPASITLAQGIIESSSGNSELARNANNHFGIKCHNNWDGETYYMDDDEKNECFRKYNNPEQSFDDHSQFLLSRKRYANLFKLSKYDYREWAYGLKEAGYATNPKYPEILISCIEKYKLYQYDSITEDNFDSLMKSSNIKRINEPKIIADRNTKEQKIIISTQKKRHIFYNNNVPYIITEKNDNIQKIAKELEMMPWQIIKYNDLPKNYKLKQNEILYIKPKKRKAKENFYIVEKGDTPHSISQKYAIKLKRLCRINKINKNTNLKPNTKILLR